MRLQTNVYWGLVCAIGLFGGILNGALGVGAAIFLVPLMTMVLGLPQLTAQGSVLWIMIPMSLMSALRYSTQPGIALDYSVIFLMAIVAVVGANIGSSIAFALPAALLKKVFGAFVVVAGIQMLVSK
jgi:uncharacterized membrane protein YfcA